jgi:hypothetical protein
MSDLTHPSQVPLDPSATAAATAGTVATPAAPATPADTAWRTVLRVAWLSIGLGLALEILLLMIVAFSGTHGDTPLPFVADLAQKVSWSFIVCVGLAFGATAARARPAAMGLLGLISAPAAFIAAKSVHQGVGQALGIAAGAAGLGFPFLVAGLKAIEYALLGAALGYAGRKAYGLGIHLAAGLATGIVFGAALLLASVRAAAAPPPLVNLVSSGLNELLFPVGCSLVIYAAGAMAKRLPA